jgi:tetratricopeptide (TPR) repeat protein
MTLSKIENNILELLNKAKQSQKNNEIADSIARYKIILDIDNYCLKDWQGLDHIYRHQSQLQEAVKCLRQLIMIQSRPREFTRDSDKLIEQSETAEELINICQQALAIYPQNPHFYIYTGDAYWLLRNIEQAIVSYYQAIALQPTSFPYVQLAKIYYQEDQLDQAVDAYKKAIALQPTYSKYLNLGNIYQDLQQLDLAIAAYQQAQILESAKDSVYFKLGDCYQKQQQWQEAILIYQKALRISKNRFSDAKVYRSIKNIHLQQNNIQAAIDNYKQELVHHCLMNKEHQIIYIPIAKNACTMFTSMIVEHSNASKMYHDSGQTIYRYSRRHDTQFGLQDFSCFSDSKYFKFAILRNPFYRLISGYLDKLVKYSKLEPCAQEIIREVQHFWGIKYSLKQSITFRQFLIYLANTEDHFLDKHWRSQHTFLGIDLFELDYLGQFEKLESTISFLENKFNYKITTDVKQTNNYGEHITKYIKYSPGEKFCDTYPSELKLLKQINGGYPHVKHFYTPESIELVKHRFTKDIAIYQQHFRVSCEKMLDFRYK